jgi:hypothetical protein
MNQGNEDMLENRMARGMRTCYLDVMVNDRFFRQVKYEYSPLFKVKAEDIAEYVMGKFPALRSEKKRVDIVVGGMRVHNG